VEDDGIDKEDEVEGEEVCMVILMITKCINILMVILMLILMVILMIILMVTKCIILINILMIILINILMIILMVILINILMIILMVTKCIILMVILMVILDEACTTDEEDEVCVITECTTDTLMNTPLSIIMNTADSVPSEAVKEKRSLDSCDIKPSLTRALYSQASLLRRFGS